MRKVATCLPSPNPPKDNPMEHAGVPFQIFYEEIQKLRESMLQMHRSQTETIKQGFADLGDRFDAHEEDDKAVAEKVIIIEERQRAEKELKVEALDKANRRSTLISSIVAISVTVAFKALDYLKIFGH